jgi:hypothetical protein
LLADYFSWIARISNEEQFSTFSIFYKETYAYSIMTSECLSLLKETWDLMKLGINVISLEVTQHFCTFHFFTINNTNMAGNRTSQIGATLESLIRNRTTWSCNIVQIPKFD